MGQAKPFTKEMVEKLRAILREERRYRDLALFCVGIDTCLRACDLLSLRVSDVLGRTTFTKVQQKTQRSVECRLSKHSKAALKLYLSEVATQPQASDRLLFPITVRHYNRLVQDWVALLRWSGSPTPDGRVSTHSIRRSKTTYIYDETKDIVACQHLLGHTKPWHTDRYLGGSARKALDLASRYSF